MGFKLFSLLRPNDSVNKECLMNYNRQIMLYSLPKIY